MIIDKLVEILGDNNVITYNKADFEIDWRERYSKVSVAVVMPENIAQIQKIVKICHQNNIAIVPQGGNTSTCGGAVVSKINKKQIILRLDKLNKVIDLDLANATITVESGCTLEFINQYLQNTCLFFPLKLASSKNCQIGGTIATNAGGINVLKYGNMRDLTLGIEVILPSGDIINQLYKLRKNNTNFDLKQLFIGSEGTLGIITKASLKLYPKIAKYATALLSIDNITTAIELLNSLQLSFSVSMFEIMNETIQEIYNKYFVDNIFPIQGNWLILLELEIIDNFNLELFNNKLKARNIDNAIVTQDESMRKSLLSMRENIPVAEKKEGFAVKHDIAFSRDNISDFINANYYNISYKYPTAQIIIFGHLGDGNLHYNIKFNDINYLEFLEIEKEVNQIVYKDVMKFNGSFAAEHGIGQLKTKLFKQNYDKQSFTLAKDIKNLIDPNNIFNPGKIFESL